jgi:hypothetical protein
MHTISRTNLLVRRLASTFAEYRPPIKIVVSHADAGALPTVTVDRLKKMLTDAELGGEVIEIASFSSEEAVQAGFVPPTTLEGWSRFDYYESQTPWTSAATVARARAATQMRLRAETASTSG